MGSILSLLAILSLAAGLSAAELTPARLRMDFLIGGKHAPA